jgi:hypothetical protein
MQRRRERPAALPRLEAMAELVRLGVVKPAVSEVGVLEVAATEGAPSSVASELLALQRHGKTAR